VASLSPSRAADFCGVAGANRACRKTVSESVLGMPRRPDVVHFQADEKNPFEARENRGGPLLHTDRLTKRAKRLVRFRSIPAGHLAVKALASDRQKKAEKSYGRIGNLEVMLARTRTEIAEAQRLRFEVFYEEMSATPSVIATLRRRDQDAYDTPA